MVWQQEVSAPVEDGVSEETTLLTGPIQGDVVTINQRALDLMLLQVEVTPVVCPSCCSPLCVVASQVLQAEAQRHLLQSHLAVHRTSCSKCWCT